MVRCQHNKCESRSSQQEPISVKQTGKAVYLSCIWVPDLASAGLWHRGGKIQISTTHWCHGFQEETSQMLVSGKWWCDLINPLEKSACPLCCETLYVAVQNRVRSQDPWLFWSCALMVASWHVSADIQTAQTMLASAWLLKCMCAYWAGIFTRHGHAI